MKACTVKEWSEHPFWKTHIASENCFSKAQADAYGGDVKAQVRACGVSMFFPIEDLEDLSITRGSPQVVEMGHT